MAYTDWLFSVQKQLAALLYGEDEDGNAVPGAPLGANAGVDIGDVGVKSYTTVKSGELAGSATALVMPTVACKLVKFKAVNSNAGNVYIGASGVTVVDGTTDTTSGFELDAGEETGWLPVDNLNRFYRICDNAGDDLTYLALV